MDPTLAIGNLRVMNQVTEAATAGQRFALLLVGLFAALALVLAAIGTYGVVSYSVNQRQHEFGLRMALGATRGHVLRLIVGQGLKLSIAGTAIGLLCAALLARLIESLLYDVGGTDPITFAAVGVLALITSTLACYRPARRATQADPMSALRAD